MFTGTTYPQENRLFVLCYCVACSTGCTQTQKVWIVEQSRVAVPLWKSETRQNKIVGFSSLYSEISYI